MTPEQKARPEMTSILRDHEDRIKSLESGAEIAKAKSAARLEALEEAAKIALDYDTGGVSGEDHLACSIAAAIRERAKS